MTMPLTREELIEAINEGRVTCNISGRVNVTPQQARKFLLSNLDRIFDPKYEVDLSFEKKYAHLLNGETPSSRKITSHKSRPLKLEKQNQR